MTRVLHVVDASVPPDLAGQLAMLARDGQQVICLGPAPAELAGQAFCLPAWTRLALLAPWRLTEALAEAAVVHAWSIASATAALTATRRSRAVVVLSLAPHIQALPKRLVGKGRLWLIVPNEWQAGRLAAAGLDRRRIFVLPPAVAEGLGDARRRSLTRRDLGLAEDQPLLVAPAPLSAHSGHKFACWAHAILRQLLPNVRLLIPNGGRWVAPVRRFAETTGYGSEVLLSEGRVRLADALSAGNVALFLHERDEGLGAVAAAMSAGVPIVASATPGVCQLLADGRSALLVEPGKPKLAAAAALRLLEDRELAEQISAAARQTAAQFELPAVSAKLQEFYRSLKDPSGGEYNDGR